MLSDADLKQISYNMCGTDFLFTRLRIWAKAKKIYREATEELNIRGVKIDPFVFCNHFKIGLN